MQRRILKKSSASFMNFSAASARRERAVVDVFSAEAREARCDRGSRVFVSEMQLDERREAQAQPVGVGFGKCGAEKPVEQESRFEVGAGERVLDRFGRARAS